MTTLTQTIPNRTINRPGVMLWLTAFAGLGTLLVLLTAAIIDNPMPPQDVTVMDWVAGWDSPVLGTFFGVVSLLTSAYAGLIYGSVGMAVLLLLGKFRAALIFGVVGFAIGFVSVLGDFTLGEIVDRGRPLAGSDNPTPSYPSGHVFGSTVFFGFIGFVAIYYQLRRKLLVPLLVLVAAIILLVGPARIYEQAHWPSDVVAGYFLAGLWLMVVIPVFVHVRGTRWMASWRQREDLSPVASESYRVARSIASVVVLDPEQGTATKVYKPPPVVRLLYWLAFQAKFPYESNASALEAGRYRRQIASLLTIHRFGKDLVAPVTSVNCGHGQCSFVTEYVPGQLAEKDEPSKRFLTAVSQTFAEAGLSVWQVNPHNPHAHTNLIMTPEGDFKVIDLESAVISLLPAPGQFRSSLKSGNLPIFDDIDFPRLREYARNNEAALEASLGADGLADLSHATDRAEETIKAWKDSEPRIWGHIISRVYRLLDWKAFFQRSMGALAGADRVAEVFLCRGIDRWEGEGRISSQEAAELRTHLSSRRVQDALHHLGAHLVLSVIPVPVPGMRSLARFMWTVAFWIRVHARPPQVGTSEPVGKSSNIHTPLVMLLALIPGVGSVAYLAARPLRRKLLIRLMLDEVGGKLPLRLYERTHLDRWVAPPPKWSRARSVSSVPADATVS